MSDISKQIKQVLSKEGLSDWKVIYKVDGYCWSSKKIIQTIEGDFSVFLHEVAHALCTKIYDGDQHHGIWGSHYTKLVRKYMVPKEVTNG